VSLAYIVAMLFNTEYVELQASVAAHGCEQLCDGMALTLLLRRKFCFIQTPPKHSTSQRATKVSKKVNANATSRFGSGATEYG
jgi:hypothetical protein